MLINKQLTQELKEMTAKLSVLTGKKTTKKELVERYINEGLARDKKRKFTKTIINF